MAVATNSYPIFDWRRKIPEVRKMMNSPEDCKVFIEHVTLNSKRANWQNYKFSLKKSSYQSFMFAFLLKCKTLDPASVITHRFVDNAKIFKKFVFQNEIELSEVEEEFLDYCCHYKNIKYSRVERAQYIEHIFKNLCTLYVA